MAKKKGNGGSQAFAVAQQIGKSLFLPIAVLPPCRYPAGYWQFLHKLDNNRNLWSFRNSS